MTDDLSTDTQYLKVIVAAFAATAGTSTPYIVICGRQSDGTITPIRVDANGQILIEGT